MPRRSYRRRPSHHPRGLLPRTSASDVGRAVSFWSNDLGYEPIRSPETGELSFGGWIWRYDLEAIGPSRTTVTLTYDWSAVPPEIREYLHFPPFEQYHLDNSLRHLSELVA